MNPQNQSGRILISILFCFLCLGQAKAARTLIGNLYYNLDASSQTATVVDKNDLPSANASYVYDNLVIPNEVTSEGMKYTVVEIAHNAFEGCNSLKSVVIPATVTKIGNYAFSGCSILASVTIPNSVKSIGEGAFHVCEALASIHIPNSVTDIGNWAFFGCTALSAITIPSSVTNIGKDAFSDCRALSTVILPNSINSLGWYCFAGDHIRALHVSWANPLNINETVFFNASVSALYVPSGTKPLYASAKGWKNIKHIEEKTAPIVNRNQ